MARPEAYCNAKSEYEVASDLSCFLPLCCPARWLDGGEPAALSLYPIAIPHQGHSHFVATPID